MATGPDDDSNDGITPSSPEPDDEGCPSYDPSDDSTEDR